MQRAPTADRGEASLVAGGGRATAGSRARTARLPPAWVRAERAPEGEEGAAGVDGDEGSRKKTKERKMK